MAVLESFKRIVNEGKRRKVILSIKNSMIANPTLENLDDHLRYAESRIPNFYDVHDGEVFDYNKSSWTEDYLDKQLFTIIDNFSKERIEFLRQIVTYIYADRIKQFNAERQAERKQNSIGKKEVGACVAGAGIIACVVGAIMEAPAVAIVGTVAVIGGGALIVADVLESKK